MKRLCIALCLLLAGPDVVNATAHYPHAKRIGCTRLGYHINVPTPWLVVNNCTARTTVTGGNPRIDIAILTDAPPTWTRRQEQQDIVQFLRAARNDAAVAAYIPPDPPKAISVAGHPGTWGVGSLTFTNGSKHLLEIYEVYSAGLRHRLFFVMDYSGGKQALTDAVGTMLDLESSLTIR